MHVCVFCQRHYLANIYVCMYFNTFLCMYIFLRKYMYIFFLYMYICLHVYLFYIFMYMCIYSCIYHYVYICTYVYMHICMSMNVCFIHACLCFLSASLLGILFWCLDLCSWSSVCASVCKIARHDLLKRIGYLYVSTQTYFILS